MVKYKLVDTEGYTRRGETGETLWLDGLEKVAFGKGTVLCTADVIHYYDHPLLSVLFNPAHANIQNPRLIEIEIDKSVAHDGLKGGCKKAKYLREIVLPVITMEKRIIFAIEMSSKYYIEYYIEDTYKKWAENWLSGKDRSVAMAVRAESVATERAEKEASVAWRVSSVASAAAKVASAAARAARAESAEMAARAVAESAEMAAMTKNVAEINKLFIETIEKIYQQIT